MKDEVAAEASTSARCPHCRKPLVVEVTYGRWPRWADQAIGLGALFVFGLCLLYIVHLDTRVVEMTRERDALVHQLSGESP